MRVQLALNVDDLERAIDYYSAVFGVGVNKREPGYANFVVQNPPLKLVLFEAPGAERLNHVGFELFDDAPIEAMAERLAAAGLLSERQQGEVCCYARQNKAISHDPQGLMWEWYRVLEDSPTFFAVDREGEAGNGQHEKTQPFVGELTACGTGRGCC
ncbi:MAG: ArsI/CadI family heavy metal resistance metalloenzyme [Pseudomonadales bacterium]|nr:VOC family protein [Pseudomonadales bacterium]